MRKYVLSLFTCLCLAMMVWVSPAISAPKDIDGKWKVTGTHKKLGKYKGTVTIKKYGHWYRVSQVAKYNKSGKTKSYTAWGRMNGKTLTTRFWRKYEAANVVGSLRGNNSRTKYEMVSGTYTLSRSGKTLYGSYKSNKRPEYSSKERFTRKLTDDNGGGNNGGGNNGGGNNGGNDDPAPKVTPDIDVILQNGQALSDDKEEKEGGVVQINIDDDDNDGGKGGDGQSEIKADKDDTNGVQGEDDLLTAKIKAVTNYKDGYVFRITYQNSNIRVYKDATKKELIKSGSTFPANKKMLIYIEGIKETSSEGAGISVEVVDAKKRVLGSDKVKINVARMIFCLNGHGSAAEWSVPSYCRRNALYGTSNPWLLKGKDQSGNTCYYAVYSWGTQKLAKIAMGAPGGYVCYDGHSNFGLGYAFKTNKKTIAEFMNIAAEYVPINWVYMREHQHHPQLMFKESEYGDDKTTAKKYDVVGKSGFKVKGKTATKTTTRYFDRPIAGGFHYTLKRGAVRYKDHHYGSGDSLRIVVKAGSKDLKAKRWRMIFLNSCYGGQYYYHTFNHGVCFYTIDEASSSRTSMVWIKCIVEGQSNDEILKAINKEENINDYNDFGG